MTSKDAADEIVIRQAAKDDSAAIAELFLIASDGLAEYIWSLSKPAGISLLEHGARRYARTNTAFSYENCHLADRDGTVVGMLHAFEMEADPDAETESDPVLEPYSHLEDPGSLYISGLAVMKEFRSGGIGTKLMDCAEARARQEGLPRLSLICFERNARALAFYQRRGFELRDRRPLVPHPSLHYPDGDALLLVADLG
ncbi:GNAT family N-acetyltransferase [Denitrobaculum tricleocarpae]|uniref:GNAT family N-acetyltransferase n=1 Tax=Denitrobaculum tricleocarpae TaxID=2591009 RepID=A0A545TYF1_9PROT|nr:GNAT family N-acetyltransferase [Denitrobaculum tricleocarpae]TQV82262.1 GNAT family N-acetyltransferase [Denitrobaculum tricleocarpae]